MLLVVVISHCKKSLGLLLRLLFGFVNEILYGKEYTGIYVIISLTQIRLAVF
jgi:hypothetical protein